MKNTPEVFQTTEQLDMLRAEGCTEVQGFLFSPPRPAADIAKLVADFRRGRGAA
jgi:EAL domain-containing protein (putative c-di-GMP-specific phosphodiesterase class I)